MSCHAQVRQDPAKMTQQLIFRKTNLLSQVSALVYSKDDFVSKLLHLDLDVMKAGVLMSQALEKLKQASNEATKRAHLKTVLKYADQLYKTQKEVDAEISSLRESKGPEVASAEVAAAAPAPTEAMAESKDKDPQDEQQLREDEKETPSGQPVEPANLEGLDLDFSSWQIMEVPLRSESAEDQESQKEIPQHPGGPSATEELARVEQELIMVDAFICFEEMLTVQELFQDSVLEQIALHKRKSDEKMTQLKKVVQPVVPEMEGTWRKDDSLSVMDALVTANKHIITKLSVKGEAYMKLIDACSQAG